MALSDNDYQNILKSMRNLLRQTGFGGIDERIIPELRGLEQPFQYLVSYLKLLIDEIALGADEQLKNVLRRVRSTVETESGGIGLGVIHA
jgi:hypothetical protein